jgi:CxxC motif-containing protein (DUF1111 family)
MLRFEGAPRGMRRPITAIVANLADVRDPGTQKALADGRPDFLATGREWRTPPLWGLGLTPTVNGHYFLLHDGRAHGPLEAILWHGGEAAESRQRMLGFTAAERADLLAFLGHCDP